MLSSSLSTNLIGVEWDVANKRVPFYYVLQPTQIKSVLKIFSSYLYEQNVIQMKKTKSGKLNRTISLRITDEEYQNLSKVKHLQNTAMSKMLRKLISVVLEMVTEK